MSPLKVGQVWNTAQGLARILRIEQGYSVAWVFGSGNGEAVRFREGLQKQEHDYLYSERLRLESLHSEPLTLEKGKRYKAANGKVGTVVNVVEESYDDKPGRTLVYLVKFDDLPGRDSKLYYAGGVFKVCDSWTLVEEVASKPVAEAFPKTQENPQIFRVGEVWMTEVGTVTIKSVVGGVVKAVMAVMGNPAYGLTFSVSRAGVYESPNGLTLKHLVSEASEASEASEVPPEAPLEFKVGHSYLTGEGKVLRLTQKDNYLWLENGAECRSLTGKYYLNANKSSPKDLVKEAPTLKLEVGHTYTDASGTLTYKVVATDAPVKGYPVVAYMRCNNDWTLVGLTSNGRISSVYTHVMDVVREVKCQANTK